MRHFFLTSTAAIALVIGSGIAFAQSPSGAPGPATGGAMQGPGAGGAMKGGDAPAAASRSETAPAAQPAPRGSEMKGADTTSPAAKSGGNVPDKSGGMQDKGKSASDMKADPAAKPTASGTQPATNAKDARNPSVDSKTDSKSAGTDSKSTADGKTTGNAPAAAAPPAEKRTEITSAFKQEKVTEVTNVNFNVSIGATVPTTVSFRPLPTRIIEIYPEWRGYDFIFVRGRYVILRPQTHEIVYIIEG